MPIRAALLLLAVMFASAPVAGALAAQVPEPRASTPFVSERAAPDPANQTGPRAQPALPRYEPVVRSDSTATSAAVAADRTTITISTLALVVIAVLLLVLLLD